MTGHHIITTRRVCQSLLNKLAQEYKADLHLRRVGLRLLLSLAESTLRLIWVGFRGRRCRRLVIPLPGGLCRVTVHVDVTLAVAVIILGGVIGGRHIHCGGGEARPGLMATITSDNMLLRGNTQSTLGDYIVDHASNESGRRNGQGLIHR